MIGHTIRTLRRQHNMTQEELAELLGVSYQSVSKWERGTTTPDISLIVPLARLFAVSTDELLGMADGDARRAVFNQAKTNYWQKDMDEMYRLACEAVAEFPGDMPYLAWLADLELDRSFYRDYDRNELLHRAEQHYYTVMQRTDDAILREEAICGMVRTLSFLERPDEAKAFAEMIPEEPRATRDEVLTTCQHGEELFRTRQRLAYKTLHKALLAIHQTGCFTDAADPYVKPALDVEEAVIRAAIPNEHFLGFTYFLYQIALKRAECAMVNGQQEEALLHLSTAKRYAEEMDRLHAGGVYRFTDPLFDGYTESWVVEADAVHDSMDYMRYVLEKPLFDPIRDRAAVALNVCR